MARTNTVTTSLRWYQQNLIRSLKALFAVYSWKQDADLRLTVTSECSHSTQGGPKSSQGYLIPCIPYRKGCHYHCNLDPSDLFVSYHFLLNFCNFPIFLNYINNFTFGHRLCFSLSPAKLRLLLGIPRKYTLSLSLS